MIPPSVIQHSPVLQVLHGDFDEEFLHNVSKISTSSQKMMTLLARLSTYDSTDHTIYDGILFQDLQFYIDKKDEDLITLYILADYLCMPTTILEQIAHQCFATYFLSDHWYEGFFTYYPLLQHFRRIWNITLKQFHNLHLYNNSAEHCTTINWINGTFVSFNTPSTYITPDITYIRDVFLAGQNISRRLHTITSKSTEHTLYDYISPSHTVYNVSDIFIQIMHIAPSQVQIDDEWTITSYLLSDLKRHWKDEQERGQTHYKHCICKNCYNSHTGCYTGVSWEQHWRNIDEQEELDDYYQIYRYEHIERWDSEFDW